MKLCDKCKTEYKTPYCNSVQCLTKEIIRTEQPEQGFLTYIDGYKYPLRAFPVSDQLNAVGLVKRAVIATMRLKPTLKGILRWLGDIYGGDYGDNLKQPLERLSPATRELYRALTVINPIKEDGWIKLVTMIFDTDMAYRTRGQDMFSELRKPVTRDEVLRLFRLVTSREVPEYSADEDTKSQLRKMRMMYRLLKIATLIPPYRKFIINIFKGIDPEKMKFDINDRYWLANKYDYNFEGKTYEERMKWKEEEDKTYIPIEKPPLKPDIHILQPNQAFYNLTRNEAEQMAEKTRKFIIENYLKVQRGE